MPQQNNLKTRLLKLSLNTAILMALLSLAPLVSLKHLPLHFYFILFVFFFVNIYIFWATNIALYYIFEKRKKLCKKLNFRYLFSYVFSVTLSGIFVLFAKNSGLFTEIMNYGDFPHAEQNSLLKLIMMGIVSNTFVLFIQEVFLLREKKIKIELENAQLKLENSEATKNQLKQQIHPHFLFNSLSILKSLIKENPTIAEEYIIRLSSFLRVSVSSVKKNTVKLKDELKLCTDFIEMQKIRFGKALSFEYTIPEDVIAKSSVPGFAIQVLLENAVKHNALTEDAPLFLRIEHKAGWLSVKNNIQEKISMETSTKLGLKNLSERYKILTGHDIDIKTDNNTFEVLIKLLD